MSYVQFVIQSCCVLNISRICISKGMWQAGKKKQNCRISRSTWRHLPEIDAAPTQLSVHQRACWAIIWSSLCPAATAVPPKQHLHLWIFSERRVSVCHALAWGGNGLSIHSHYPFHLHRNLDPRPLEPVTKAGFTMGHAGSSGMARARGHLKWE